ncbi:MAG TPA: type II toxin-antitoxin system RelE/ParE family toxin [Hanamia sp.]|nr:type II toxin-antitoxin system RelE/ParE family toxin [Hanamia sp.]
MAFEIIIKPIVLLDLDEALLWYEAEQPGLAKRFYQSFEIAIERIRKNPNAFFDVAPEVKKILLKKFPYKIFYTISGNKIIILGIAHVKRSNAYIRKRLRQMP